MYSKGRILAIYRQKSARTYSVKGGHSYERTPYGYYSGYGAFSEYPETYLILKAKIYATGRNEYIDIRQDVLNATGKTQIRQTYIDYLEEKNVGKKIGFQGSGDDWELDDINELIL